MNIPSFWATQLLKQNLRPSLDENIEVDVAIAGAGFTGLWTAYYLKKKSPSLSIAVIEKSQVGFGASGRNGGWCSALFATSLEKLAKNSSRQAAINQYQAMIETVNEIEKVISFEKIEADWQRGGTITLARDQIQLKRAMAEINHFREWGFNENYLKLLNKSEASDIFNASQVYGGTYTPHCAAINPAKLVTQLADRVEKLGVKIYEDSPLKEISPHLLRTSASSVKAKYVVRALEGFTPTFKKYHRNLVPWVNHKSKMWEVEPLRFMGIQTGLLTDDCYRTIVKTSSRFAWSRKSRNFRRF
jgi:glycine/D-amino acid oxidase-like deaminating enzyme